MNGKKLLLAAISATLLVGAAAQTSFAAAPNDQHHAGKHHAGPRHARGPGMAPEVIYVRMLKQFDTDGDMKITKDEVKIGVDKVFDQIDTNKDGQITPAELRAYRQERVKAWKAEHDKMAGDKTAEDKAKGTQGDAKSDDQAGKGHHGGHKGHGQRGAWMREARMMRAAMFFQRVDKDGSGQISKQEAEDWAAKMFDRMDRNHDGVISLDDMPNRPLL